MNSPTSCPPLNYFRKPSDNGQTDLFYFDVWKFESLESKNCSIGISDGGRQQHQ
jgi:hypothetical protein